MGPLSKSTAVELAQPALQDMREVALNAEEVENSIGKPAKWYGKPAIAALEMTVEPLMHVEAPLNWMRSRNGNADLGAEKNSMCARQDSQ